MNKQQFKTKLLDLIEKSKSLDSAIDTFCEEYCSAPETKSFDFTKDKFKLLTHKELFPNEKFEGLTVSEATTKFIELVEKLGNKYYLPDETFRDYLDTHTEIRPTQEDGWKWYYYPKAKTYEDSGGLFVPCSSWDGSAWLRNGGYVGASWGSADRFLVLEIL